MRELKLIRRVTATAGGWAGDAAVWSESTPPVAATVNATELTGAPIIEVPRSRIDNVLGSSAYIPVRGVAGYIRVTGADAARRFDMDIFMALTRQESGQTDVEDWIKLKGSSPVDVGNGEDFTTDPAWMQDARIAIHLTAKLASLADGSVVEVWAAEI